MFDILMVEIIKLKRSKVLPVLILMAILQVILGMVTWHRVRLEFGAVIDWSYLFTFVQVETLGGIPIIMYSVITIHLIASEYNNGTISTVFTYPHFRLKFLAAKLIVIFSMLLLTAAMTFLLTLAGGYLFIHFSCPIFILKEYVKIFLWSVLLQFSLMPAAAALSLVGKNYIFPSAVAIGIYMFNPLVQRMSFYGSLPWNIPHRIVQSLQPYLNWRMKLVRIPDYKPYVAISICIFLIPLIFDIVYYLKADVLEDR